MQAIVVGVVITVTAMPAAGEVTARLGGADVAIATVHAGWAAVVLLAFGGLVDVAVARIEPLAPRARLVTWIGWSQLSGVAVFLIAQLNGITELTTLVALYALTAGAVMMLALDGALVAPRMADPDLEPAPAPTRTPAPTPAPTSAHASDAPAAPRGSRGLRRPAALAAVIGIVPWGLIAFAQIGGGIAGDPVGVWTRVVTLVVLALSIAVWFRGWFRPADADAPGILPVLATSALAWGVVAALG